MWWASKEPARQDILVHRAFVPCHWVMSSLMDGTTRLDSASTQTLYQLPLSQAGQRSVLAAGSRHHEFAWCLAQWRVAWGSLSEPGLVGGAA
jgi:hypothetical protein